jgi:uroporphyrinogen-III synthase
MKAILVVRKFDVFSEILAENSFEIINLPLIETKALNDLSEFEAKLAHIENYDGVFLTSRFAAEIFRAKSVEKNINYPGKVYVLGRRGFEILKTANFDLFFDETAHTARGMLEKIALENFQDKRFLFVRGEKSLRVVPDSLSKFAAVDEAIVYRTEKLTLRKDELKIIVAKIEKNEIACACFFSPSAAKSFAEQFGAAILHQTIIATIGKTTAEFFREQNLTVDFVSSKATAKDFAVELIEYLGKIQPTKEAKRK